MLCDVVMVQAEDRVHTVAAATRRSRATLGWEPSSSGGVCGRMGGEAGGPGPLTAPASLGAHPQPDAVCTGLRGRVP